MESKSKSVIPVIDFAQYDVPDQRDVLASEMCHALRTVGFMYLTNHGVPDQQIQNAFTRSTDFFQLSEEQKVQFAAPRDQRLTNMTAYNGIGSERLDPSGRKEVREAFDLITHNTVDIPACPEFIPALVALDRSYRTLAKKVLHCIGLGMGLSDPYFFVGTHKHLDDATISSGTMFRTLYYPPENDPDPNWVRLGTHTDYGTVTLLVQDQVGGLEVMTTDEIFVPATPIPGTVVVNIGDLLQRWTSDELKATYHRVLSNETKRTRQSLVIFVHPDSDTLVEALEGRSQKYPPITAKAHLQKRYETSFAY